MRGRLFPVACIGLVLAYAALPAAQRSAQGTPPPGLPIRRVVLYKVGVGYFEHLARVVGSGEVAVQFTNRQLDDVLNSLTALDLDDGRITGISYDSAAPLDQRLGALAVQLPPDANRSQFYAALRGVRIEVSAGASRIAGRLLSVERQSRASARPVATVDELTVISDDGRVRTFDLGPGVTVRIADQRLREDVGTYLALVGSTRTQDLRHVTIATSGTGTRRLLVSYVSEVPVWKSTYRLVFSDDTESPLLQGWAIVDNTTAEDWTNVDLSLVAGAPQSFVQNVSQPYYTQRPVVPLPRALLLRPQVHEPTLTTPQRESAVVSGSNPAMGRLQSEPGLVRTEGGLVGRLESPPPPPPPSRLGGIQPVAVGQPLADLFDYHVQDPVTIRRNQSALVPILSEPVEAERVSLWRPLLPDNRPLRALWMTNSGELTIDGGTFSVVDDGTFAGEGLIEPLKPAERRLISYGTDLGLVVAARNDPTSRRIARVTAHDGIVVSAQEDRSRWEYTVRNADTTARTLIVEHPVKDGWTMEDNPAIVETTASMVRFRLSVGPGREATLIVTEHHAGETHLAIGDVDEARILSLVQGGVPDPDLRRAMQPVIAKRTEVATAEAHLVSVEAQMGEIVTDQERLRANMKALGTTKDERVLLQRYTRALDAEESRLTDFQAESKRLSAERDGKRAELSRLITTLAFDLSVE